MASDNLLIMATHLRPRSLFLAATLTLMQYVLASKDVGLIADTPNAELIADVPNGMQLPSVQTVSVNRYGSMCPAPSISTSTSTHMAPSTPTTASATLTRPWISGSPAPYSNFTRCTDPVCPALNNKACRDAAGKTYGISCNATLSGPIVFPPRLRPRTYAADFTACLAICDREGGCHGVSYSRIGSNCLLYGEVTGTQPQNWSIAARRLDTYT